MESFRPTAPFRQSTNHLPRSKTTGSSYSTRPIGPERLKRSRTPTSYDDDGGPWEHTNTYVWVLEQEYQNLRKHGQPTARSTSKGKHASTTEWPRSTSEGNGYNFKAETAYNIDMQARLWMAQEEMRRIAALREAEKTRLVQEEVRRIQAWFQQKYDADRRRIQEERHRTLEESKEREQRERRQHAAERAIVNAWRLYETRWNAISTNSELLTFRCIPWPLVHPPSDPASITLEAIASFLLSPLHSGNRSQKERIKEALRRWHPDRFRRWTSRVPDNEKAAVDEGVGIVARCLNELLSRQWKASIQARPS